MTSGGVEDDKNRPPASFQGVSSNPQQQPYPPATGYPQPAQPYAPATGYVLPGPRASTDHYRLPCCGLGVGWVLFILGFFFGFPWYVGFFLFLCSKNPRERPGYIACTIGAVIATIVLIIGAMKGSGVWA